MPRILTFTMELTDEEATFFLNNRVAPAAIAANVAPVGGADDEGPVNATAPAVDKNGVPWLEAVHAGTKAMNADGTWRRKRGVDAAAAAAAEAAAKTAAPVQANISSGVEDRVDPNAAQVAALAPAPGLPPMPGLPPVLPPPAAPEPVKPVSYEELSALVQSVLTAGHTPDKVTAIYAEIGLTDVNDLLTNETLRANLAAKLRTTFNLA